MQLELEELEDVQGVTHPSKNKYVLRNDNYKIEIKTDEGLFYIRSEGVQIATFRNLTVYDFILRFYENLPEHHKDTVRTAVTKNLENFKGHVKLHRFRGDQQRFRVTGDDTRYFMEDIQLEDHGLTEKQRKELREDIETDVIWDVETTEILNEALKELEKEMAETLEKNGFEDTYKKYGMMELHRIFDCKKSVELSEKFSQVNVEMRVDQHVQT